MIPFALLPIIIRLFFDSRTALFAHIITVLIISFMVDNSFRFVVLQIAVGMAAVFEFEGYDTTFTACANCIVYIFKLRGIISGFRISSEGELEKRIHWLYCFTLVWVILLLLTYILIYILKIFGLISAVTRKVDQRKQRPYDLCFHKQRRFPCNEPFFYV